MVSYLNVASAVVMYGPNDCEECEPNEGSGFNIRSVHPTDFVVDPGSGVSI